MHINMCIVFSHVYKFAPSFLQLTKVLILAVPLDNGLAQTTLHRLSSKCTPLAVSVVAHSSLVYLAVHRKLATHESWTQLAVHVALDMVVVIEDMSELL